jgi:glycosyltransferase involved in cell wall biosynthesis
VGVFGGFSSVPRKHVSAGQPGVEAGPLIGPVENSIQGLQRQPPGTLGQVASPVVFKAKPPVSQPPPTLTKLDPQVSWVGIIHGYSGYAKANREILKRVMKSVKASFAFDSPWDRSERNVENIQLLKALRMSRIDDRAPRVTFLPPRSEPKAGYRIIYTMMETEIVHQDMIRIMNQEYHECWTPTQWNANTFRKSGLTIPVRVMPLGVDPDIYYQDGPASIPKALRLTGEGAGKYEVPEGFLFIYVCQPTFRKGIEVVIEAFGEAFKGDREAGLIIAATTYSTSLFTPDKSIDSRIWLLDAPCSEKDLAATYRACKGYVCASRGEGWNLPLSEAAACGLPVIAPRTSAHADLVPEGCGFLFSPDHARIFPTANKVSQWFEGIPFPDFGPKSHRELVRLLRLVKQGYPSAQEVGRRYMNLVRSKYTWDLAAKNVAERIKELCRG